MIVRRILSAGRIRALVRTQEHVGPGAAFVGGLGWRIVLGCVGIIKSLGRVPGSAIARGLWMLVGCGGLGRRANSGLNGVMCRLD